MSAQAAASGRIDSTLMVERGPLLLWKWRKVENNKHCSHGIRDSTNEETINLAHCDIIWSANGVPWLCPPRITNAVSDNSSRNYSYVTRLREGTYKHAQSVQFAWHFVQFVTKY